MLSVFFFYANFLNSQFMSQSTTWIKQKNKAHRMKAYDSLEAFKLCEIRAGNYTGRDAFSDSFYLWSVTLTLSLELSQNP